ncbi:MAG: hypothetical protein J6D52_02170 [Clostridia bacterium]|nr:hypothetical protein [Clostridia bacterium]
MQKDLKYFLAANSGNGFLSLFDSCYNAKDGWKVYIIKGGPGTGKSSFMKYMIKRAAEKNEDYIRVPCSSDPNSLDAVILKSRKTIIMDGTSPHTVDPRYPAVCEEILDFGRFWDKDKLIKSAEEIISLTDKNKQLHKRASGYIKAAGQFVGDNLKLSDSLTDDNRLRVFAKRLCRKRIPQKNSFKESGEDTIFLGGITPDGIISYSETVEKLCKKTVIISDESGSVANKILLFIKNYARENGYEIITVKNPLLPDSLLDGIILPELSLGFLRENEFLKINSDCRRIHARRFIHAEQISKSRGRIKFNKKTAETLLKGAVEILGEAKAVHDELERYYIEAMDFGALDEYRKEFADLLFS